MSAVYFGQILVKPAVFLLHGKAAVEQDRRENKNFHGGSRPDQQPYSIHHVLLGRELRKVATLISQLFSIASQGRAYNCHALVNLQRPDATFLEGFRENFSVVIGLSRISPEAAKMVGFTDYPEFSGINCGQSVGWMLTDEGILSQVRVPHIREWDNLHNSIIAAVTR